MDAGVFEAVGPGEGALDYPPADAQAAAVRGAVSGDDGEDPAG